MTNAATTDRKAQRAAEHARYKAEAAARREAERTRRKEHAEARAAARRALRTTNGDRRRRALAQRSHDALMRRVFGLQRDLASAPLETEDGTPFVSMEFGDDPASPALFVLQRDPACERQIVIDSRTGEVVARGGSREAALRAFAKTLPAVVVMPRMDSKGRRTAWRGNLARRNARKAAGTAGYSKRRAPCFATRHRYTIETQAARKPSFSLGSRALPSFPSPNIAKSID